VHVWDVRTGREIGRRPSSYASAEISPDGRRVLLEGLIWDLETGRTVKTGAGTLVAFSPAGHWVATTTGDGADVRDVLTGRRVTQIAVGTTEPTAIAFGDETRLFTSHLGGTTHEWDVGARRLEGGGGMALSAAASRDGKLVAGLSGTAKPVVWDAESGRLRLGLPQHGRIDAEPTYQVGFTPAGQLVHVALDRTNIEIGFRVVDVPTGLTVRSFGRDAYAIDGRGEQTLAVVGDETSQQLRFTDARGRETTAEAPPDAYQFALSPDGRLVAIATGTNVEVWETPRLRRLARLDADDSSSDTLRFSQDGARVLASDLDGRVYVWSLADGRPVVITAHKGFVNTAEFSDDGRYVVSAGEDGAARVWSAHSGRLLGELPSSGAAAFLPGSRELVTLGTGPPLIRPCDMCGTWGRLVERIDERARRGLTPAERAAYVR
jgi:WD40 repeat protein